MSLEAVETDLLAAIAADPDAIEPRLIYADWLQAREDPRGELIVVQAGRLAHPDDVQLQERERELTTALTNGLVLRAGPNTVTTDLVGRWHLGFVDKISVDVRTIRMLRTTLREWFARPEFGAVRELDITSKYARDLRFIRHLGLAKTVRRVQFGEHYQQLQEPTIEAIAARLPQVTALALRTREVPPLRALRRLALRELQLHVTELTDEGFRHLAEVPWTLETFGLHTTQFTDDRGPLIAQLYDGTVLSGVKHFVLGGAMPVIDILETLATSKRAATVETFTADFHRTTYEQLQRAERHRAALANMKLAPLLQDNAYYAVDNFLKVGSLLNYRLDRPAEALAYYQQGLRIREDSTLRHHLGVALRKLKRFDESLVAFDTIINASRSPTASMFNARHYTLCELGRRDEARADLERAIKIDPNFADAWNNLGIERQYIGDADGALAAFRRCMELDPEHNYALRNEADLLLELGRAAEALAIYQRLAPARSSDRSLLSMIAHAQVELRDAAGARATLDARFADPQQARHQRFYVLRALALRELREHAASRADLDECARITDCPAWFALTVFVRSLHDRAMWTRMVPDTAITPRAIADAAIAYAKTARPVGAAVLHDAGDDDQLDCAELGVAAALLANDRALAVARAHAAAAHHAEQGPRYFRMWWQLLATVMRVAERSLDDDARAMLWLVLRAVRGRARIADVMALDT